LPGAVTGAPPLHNTEHSSTPAESNPATVANHTEAKPAIPPVADNKPEETSNV
jgi:hypothetical protein